MIDPTLNPTIQTPSVNPPSTDSPPPPRTPAPAAAGPQTAYEAINYMLSQKLVTALVKKQKMQYSILHFGEFQDGWLICEVENLSGATAGEDLLIVVAKTTPITLYVGSAVTAPPFTA